MIDEKIIEILKKELVVAMGCTEPAASALAGSKASELLGCVPDAVTVFASRDMVKNAMAVGIPNCKERGILTAVCLGIFSENPIKDLSILSVVTERQREMAKKLAEVSSLELEENAPSVYVRVDARGGGHTSSCTISYEHDRFTRLLKDGREQPLPGNCGKRGQAEREETFLKSLTLEDVVNFVRRVDKEQIRFVLDSARTNYQLSCYSIEHDYGLKTAKTALADLPKQPSNLHEAMTFAAAYAAAGSDARMSGCPQAVVINSGSGNQGITCSVPLVVLADYLGSSESQLIEALCLSQIIGLMITARKSRLSALCGALTAAMGAGCGMVHLMGGGLDEMNRVICNMVGNLAGIICDGAKNSCALKIFSSVEAAGLAVRMAFNGEAPGREGGIIGGDAMESIENLMNVSKNGMENTDRVILSIMLDKQS